MRFQPHPKHKDALPEGFSLLLERRSLLIFRDDIYTKYLHTIEEKTSDRVDNEALGSIRNLPPRYQQQLNSNDTNQKDEEVIVLERDTRISLTIRRVKKVLRKM